VIRKLFSISPDKKSHFYNLYFFPYVIWDNSEGALITASATFGNSESRPDFSKPL
jgi:hypothetical protein